MEFYPDASEEIPEDLPPKHGPRFRMTVYVDSDHAHSLFIRISFIGILVMRNNTSIIWISMIQKTVETSIMDQNLGPQ
jgi:hypothetical protein